MSRVLVTGATGFIGRGTLAPLISAGFEVHAVSRRPTAPTVLREVRWESADLLQPGAAENLVERVGPTHLLHLAWYAEPGAFWHSVENLRWVEASLRLLRAFARHGGTRAVVAGSCAEYEWGDRVRCLERETPCRPATLYGASKYALHVMAEKYAEQVEMSLAWGRIFFVFGPGEDPRRLGASVARSAVLGQPAPVSHGRQIRDFLYSEDLADAFVTLLRSPVQGPVNLASGTPMRIRDLVAALAAAAGRPDLIRFGARGAASGEPQELVANIDRLRDEVGWEPSATLEQRAAETIAWWRSELIDVGRHQAPA